MAITPQQQDIIDAANRFAQEMSDANLIQFEDTLAAIPAKILTNNTTASIIDSIEGNKSALCILAAKIYIHLKQFRSLAKLILFLLKNDDTKIKAFSLVGNAFFRGASLSEIGNRLATALALPNTNDRNTLFFFCIAKKVALQGGKPQREDWNNLGAAFSYCAQLSDIDKETLRVFDLPNTNIPIELSAFCSAKAITLGNSTPSDWINLSITFFTGANRSDIGEPLAKSLDIPKSDNPFALGIHCLKTAISSENFGAKEWAMLGNLFKNGVLQNKVETSTTDALGLPNTNNPQTLAAFCYAKALTSHPDNANFWSQLNRLYSDNSSEKDSGHIQAQYSILAEKVDLNKLYKLLKSDIDFKGQHIATTIYCARQCLALSVNLIQKMSNNEANIDALAEEFVAITSNAYQAARAGSIFSSSLLQQLANLFANVSHHQAMRKAIIKAIHNSTDTQSNRRLMRFISNETDLSGYAFYLNTLACAKDSSTSPISERQEDLAQCLALEHLEVLYENRRLKTSTEEVVDSDSSNDESVPSEIQGLSPVRDKRPRDSFFKDPDAVTPEQKAQRIEEPNSPQII